MDGRLCRWRLRMTNGIPLGMGCGSSAAARLAAIALAVHFGQLDWDTDRILEEAYALEGHPDNVAACWLGGFVSAVCEDGEDVTRRVHTLKIDPPEEWRAIVALPAEPLATSKARAVLPATYRDGRCGGESAIGSPAGAGVCPGAGRSARAGDAGPHSPAVSCASSARCCHSCCRWWAKHGILGVALSGAGPAVLVIVESEKSLQTAATAIGNVTENRIATELTMCRFSRVGASQAIENK